MTNPKEEESSVNLKLPPIEYICASCRKRKWVGDDRLDDDDVLQVAHKKLKLEAKPEPADDDDSSACALSTNECMENDKDSMKERDEKPLPKAESAEDELRESISSSSLRGFSRNLTLGNPSIERLRKEWTSPIYAFFKSSPAIRYVGTRRVHVFECLAENCKAKGKNPRFVNRYLDKTDARSTSNLRKHVKNCWGVDILAAADKNKDLDAVRAVIGKMSELKDGRSLAAAIEGLGKGKLNYILSL